MDSLWDALGLDVPGLDEIVAPHHRECVLPDGLIVDREIAQLIAALRASAVSTVECCADGWGSGYGYVIVRTIGDLAKAARLLGHRISADAWESMGRAVSPAVSQWRGPWWPSEGGWAVGWLSEPDHPCPAIAWPRTETKQLTQRVLDTTRLAPVRLRRVPLMTWLERNG